MSEDSTRTGGTDAIPTDAEATVLLVGEPSTRAEEDFGLLEEIGRGAMGVVYRAMQPGLNRPVALKMLLGDEASQQGQRFLAEAEAVASLDHPHVVRVYEFGRRGDRPYLAMEYLPGGTLARRLADGPKPSPRQAAILVRKLALGVGTAHAAGIVHRDLKPANVLFDASGEPKVADFGLAKRTASDLTATNAVMGTPAYMAPEQARGVGKFVGPPADVWALGVILYEALAGARPFVAGESWAMLQVILNEEPRPIAARCPEAPRDLGVIVAKCLRKEAVERYPTAIELAEDLGRFLDGEPIRAKPVGAAERALKWVVRKPAIAIGWGSAVLAALALTALAVTLKLRDDAVAARHLAEGAQAEAGRSRGAERAARLDAEAAGERVARAEYARTVNLAHRESQRSDLRRADEYLKLCRPDLRGWEWDYLQRLCHPEWEVIPEPLASDDQPWSADGLTYLTRGNAGRIHVRRVDGGIAREIVAGDPTRWACLSPDARVVATGDGATCRLWDAATGTPRREIRHAQGIRSAAFTSDSGSLIAFLAWPSEAASWERKVLGLKDTVPANPEPKAPASIAEAALWPLAGDAAQPLIEWRSNTGFQADRQGATNVAGVDVWGNLRMNGVLTSPAKRVLVLPDGSLVLKSVMGAVAWSSDGRSASPLAMLGDQFALGHAPRRLLNFADGTLSEVDIDTQQTAWSFPIGTTRLAALSAASDPDRVVLGCNDGRVETWSVSKKVKLEEFRGFSLGSKLSACRLSADGRWLLAGDGSEVRIWKTDQPVTSRENSVYVVVKSIEINAKSNASAPRLPPLLSSRSLQTQRIGGLDMLQPHWSDLFFPIRGERALREGTISRRFGPEALLNADRSIFYLNGDEYPIAEHDPAGNPESSPRRSALEGASLGQQAVCHDADDLLADWKKGGDETVLRIRSFDPGPARRTLDLGEKILAVTFARRGHTLYVVGKSGAISAWDADSGVRIWTRRGVAALDRSCIDVSPDGRRLATGGPSDTVLLRDAADGTLLATLRGHRERVECVRFSPDGRRLATAAGREIKIWEPESGQDLLTLDAERGDGLDFSPDSTQLVRSNGQMIAAFAATLDMESIKIGKMSLRFWFRPQTSYGVYEEKLGEQIFDSRPMRASR